MFNRKFKNAEDRANVRRKMIAAGTNHEGQSNREFAEKNEIFQLFCAEAGVQSTKRQASKYRRKMGKAYSL